MAYQQILSDQQTHARHIISGDFLLLFKHDGGNGSEWNLSVITPDNEKILVTTFTEDAQQRLDLPVGSVIELLDGTAGAKAWIAPYVKDAVDFLYGEGVDTNTNRENKMSMPFHNLVPAQTLSGQFEYGLAVRSNNQPLAGAGNQLFQTISGRNPSITFTFPRPTAGNRLSVQWYFIVPEGYRLTSLTSGVSTEEGFNLAGDFPRDNGYTGDGTRYRSEEQIGQGAITQDFTVTATFAYDEV